MIEYVKHFGADKRMSFKANDKKNYLKYTLKYEKKCVIYLAENLILDIL